MVYTVWLCCIVLTMLKTLYGVFNFYIFQHFILVVALCVGEVRALSVQGIFGHHSARSFHVFCTWARSCGQHLFLLCVSFYPPLHLLFTSVCIYTVY